MLKPNINPTHSAYDLHYKIGWTKPADYTLEEIANSQGLMVRESNINGSEGRILTKGDMGIITLNCDIGYQPKKNFILAHEIGHFILHKNIMPVFSDTNKTLSDWYKKGNHEKEANEFAAALLMPEQLFRKKIDNRKLELSLIEEISKYFMVSMTTAFLRYIEHGRYPLMVIFLEGGIVKWKKATNDFPFKWLPRESKVPAYTVAGDYFNRNRIEKKPEKVDAIEWFPDDWQIKYNKDAKLWEQCYPVSENGLISCLWA